MISTAAGIIVSRAAAEAKMGEEYLGQLTYHHRGLRLVSGILLLFALVPGMPTISFLIMSALVFAASKISAKNHENTNKQTKGGAKQPKLDAAGKALPPSEQETFDTPEDMQTLLPLDQLELEVGYGLIPLVDEAQDGNLLARIRSIRRQFALDMGVVIPSLHLRDNLQLKPGEYNLIIKGNVVAGSEILIDHFLAMDPGDAKHNIKGIDTLEPAFNLPAIWIPEAQREAAMLAGYTVVDPATVIATHLTEIFRKNLHEFLGRQEVQELLDNLLKRAPKAVEDLIPGIMSLGTVQKVLQKLIQENVSIRDTLSIIETLADYGSMVHDAGQLTEYVRTRLNRTIIKQYLGSQNTLPIIVLSPQVDGVLQAALKPPEQGNYLVLDPTYAQKLIQQIGESLENASNFDGQPVLLTTPLLRPHLAQLMIRFLPTLPVISQAEIPADIRIQSIASVDLT